MTSWEPYPTTSPRGSEPTASAPGVTYEPYPTIADPQPPRVPSQALQPYRPYVDPFTVAPARPSVAAADAGKLALKNWNNFSGRASRSEFWWPGLAWVLGSVAVQWLGSRGAELSNAGQGVAATGLGVAVGVISMIMLLMFLPMLSLAVRRLHDTGRRGTYVLLGLIPVVGQYILAWFLAKPSDPAGAQFDDPSRQLYGPEDLRH